MTGTRWLGLVLLASLALPWSGAEAAFSCTVSSTGVTVVGYAPSAQSTAQGQATVQCTRSSTADATSLTVFVYPDNGLYAAGQVNRAQNTSQAGNYVNYDLYTDSACATSWKSNPAGNQLPANGATFTWALNDTTTQNSGTYNYWACVPSAQTTVVAGTHTDPTVTLSVEYRWGSGQSFATSTSTMPVSVTVPANCSVTTAPGTIALTYTASGPAATANTTFATTCTNLSPYTLTLDNVPPTGTTTTSGSLIGVNYTLTLSAGGGTGNGVGQTYTITGNIAAGQQGSCPAPTCTATGGHTLYISY